MRSKQAIYTGSFLDGVFSGADSTLINFDQYGRQTFKYRGGFQKGMPHGLGEEINENRHSYTGSYVDGRYEGSGVLTEYKFLDGQKTTLSKYEGCFKHGQPDGEGVLKQYPDGKERF